MHIMKVVMKHPPNTQSLKRLLRSIEMNTGPVNCGSQQFHLKGFPWIVLGDLLHEQRK